MRKGADGAQVIGVFTNQGAGGGSYTLSLNSGQTGFSGSEAVMEILTCTSYTTDSSGTLALGMANGLPRILYPRAQLVGGGICSL